MFESVCEDTRNWLRIFLPKRLLKKTSPITLAFPEELKVGIFKFCPDVCGNYHHTSFMVPFFFAFFLPKQMVQLLLQTHCSKSLLNYYWDLLRDNCKRSQCSLFPIISLSGILELMAIKTYFVSKLTCSVLKYLNL